VYYISLFHLRPSDTAQEMNYRLCVDNFNTTHILVDVSKNLDATPNCYMPSDMKKIINEYIEYAFRNNYKEIQPFSLHGRIREALYLFDVTDKDTFYTLDFVYIDSPLAFQLVQNDECKIEI
jgi:hypothetical protein